MAAAPFFKSGAPAWYVVIIFIPVVAAFVGFIVLLAIDRDKLQSEEYQLRKQSLELIQEKGQEFPVNPTSIDIIANPEPVKRLEEHT